jgi:hypothetical protein
MVLHIDNRNSEESQKQESVTQVRVTGFLRGLLQEPNILDLIEREMLESIGETVRPKDD